MSKFNLKLEQYFNLSNARFTFTNLINGTRPDFFPRKKFCEVDFIKLIEMTNSIKYVILDKDNTITLPYSEEIGIKERSVLSDLQNKLGWTNVVLVSNSIGSSDDDNIDLLSEKEKKLSVKIIAHRSKKPKINFDKFVPDNLTSKEILVVGDRLMVDVYMGSSKGFLTLLVNPIDHNKDNFMVRLCRYIEDRILRNF